MDIKFDFSGKVAVVTGAASGIGLACCEMLAAAGAKVAMTDLAKPLYTGSVAEAAEGVKKKGTARAYNLDVTEIAKIGPTISQIRKDLGEIDILVSSAGINRPSTSADITEADWEALLNLDLKGLFFCDQQVAVQSMLPRKKGSIINIASIAGLAGLGSFICPAHYSAAKGAVVQLTRKLGVEWGEHNVRVNAVAPTFTATAPVLRDLDKNPEVKAFVVGGTPLRRMATPEEVAAAVCFLASDAAGIITGITLPVDGGWTAQ